MALTAAQRLYPQQATNDPNYVDPREATYVKDAGGVLSRDKATAQWTPKQYKSVAEFMADRPKGDTFTGRLDQGAAERGGQTVGPTFYENHQLAADTGAWNKYGVDNGFIPKDGGLTWGFKDAFLNPAVLAAVGGYAFGPSGAAASEGTAGTAGAAATTASTTSSGAATLTADQLMAQSVAGLSVATPLETATALGIGGAGVGATAGTAATTTDAYGASVQQAANVPTTAAQTGGGSLGAKAADFFTNMSFKDAISLVSTGATLAGAIGSVGPGGISPPEPSAPPQDQQGSNVQDVQQADANDQRFPNLGGSGDDTLFNGASGIDPFMLNLGRAKLLGQ